MSETVVPRDTDREMLETLQRETFVYFIHEYDKTTGLIADKTEPGSPSSIAVVGLGLTVYTVAVDRGFLSREEAALRTLRVLRFLHSSEQGKAPDASGYKGFYYHFLDMQTGRRAWQCEISTIDTALLLAGVLTAGAYFDATTPDEQEIRALAESLYLRVDWTWVLNKKGTLRHGWTPEKGFLKYHWDKQYSEALLLYVLALGSPTFPIPEKGYRDWTKTFDITKVYDIEYLYAGPLFIHQLPQVWLDCREIRDERNREVGFDYFENSTRATLVQREYAIRNPLGFAHYSKNEWGITASDGPGPATLVIDGVKRKFFGYLARGAPFGPDDGTISPWAVVASLPFAPDPVCETIRHAIERLALKSKDGRGFDASFNGTFPERDGNENGWVSPWRFGLNQGPIVLMIENYLSESIWALFRRIPVIRNGLRRGGFRGGWLDMGPALTD